MDTIAQMIDVRELDGVENVWSICVLVMEGGESLAS